MKNKAAFDLDKWLDGYTPKTKCQTCACSPEILSLIKEFLSKVALRPYKVPSAQLHPLLKEKYGYALTKGSLRAHMQDCESTLWEKAYGKKK